MRSRRSAVLTTVVLALVLVALAPAPADALLLDRPEPLVAMGDSFTAGEGSPPFEAGTADGCRRSYVAYPQLTALGRATNLACGGATVATVLETGQFGEPPQLQQLPVDARRVAMTLGGNDLGFGELIAACVVLPDCTAASDGAVAGRLAGLADALPTVYRAILDRAPSARLFVLEYPVLLPEAPVAGCPWLPGISDAEAAWGRDVNRRLNAVIGDAVAAAAASHPGRVTVVPTEERFAGHAVCDTGIDWVRGVHPVRQWSFHPSYLGQFGLHLALRQALDG